MTYCRKHSSKFFETLPLIHREPGSGTRQTMERFIQKMNVNVNRKLELSSNEAVKQAVMAGLGLSIMPLIGIKNELNLRQLKIIPIKGLPIQTTWSLIWLKGKKHGPAANAFLDYIQENKAEIIKKARRSERRAILLLVSLSSSAVRLRKIGVFAIGFIIAKKPINTEREWVRRFSTLMPIY